MNIYVNYEKNEKLKHLTYEQIEQLINRYYSNEKVSDLIEEYDIDTRSSQLYKLFPPLICEDKICPNCNVQLVINRHSKTASSYSINSDEVPYCPICKHTDSIRCKCPSCIEKKKLEERKIEEEQRLITNKKRELINKNYSLDMVEKVEIKDLSFRDKVYLGAMLRLCLTEDFSTITSLNNIDEELAPTNELKRDIITTLSNKKIILVHPNSPIEAFTESEGNPFPMIYYIYEVNYYLNIDFLDNRQKIINNLINPPEFNKINRDEAFKIWRDIALAECLQYFKFQMEKVRFDFNPGEKTMAIFNDLIDNFSVSQIYGIIYRSIANATKFYQESNITKKRAANSVIGNCQRYAEKALINKWDLTKYNRVIECPQTMISEFFFNRVLEIGSLGFDMPPTIL